MHRPFFTGKISETLLDAFRSGGASVLTSREKTLVRLIAEGHTSKQISELLHISDKTVQAHRASAMRKLNVPNTAALVRYAVRNKLVEP